MVLLTACGQQPSSSAPTHTGVVCFGPHITETVFALGQGARVVGRTTYCDYPTEAVLKVPVVGDYLNPDFEKLTRIQPELMILPGRHEKLAEFAQLQRLQVLHVEMDSLAGIDRGIADIGQALDCVSEADALRARMNAEFSAVRASVANQPRLRVLIITGRSTHDLTSLNTAGPTSFLSELVDLAGGENLFSDAARNYLEVSKESVVMRAPEAIIELHCGENLALDEQQRFIDDWKPLSSLPAVQNGRIYIYTDSAGMRPGPRAPQVARQFAEWLHPSTKGTVTP